VGWPIGRFDAVIVHWVHRIDTIDPFRGSKWPPAPGIPVPNVNDVHWAHVGPAFVHPMQSLTPHGGQAGVASISASESRASRAAAILPFAS
jgi:hypothetical protein